MQECSMKIRAGERWHLNNSVTFTLPQLPELMESLLLGKDPGRVWSTSDITSLHMSRVLTVVNSQIKSRLQAGFSGKLNYKEKNMKQVAINIIRSNCRSFMWKNHLQGLVMGSRLPLSFHLRFIKSAFWCIFSNQVLILAMKITPFLYPHLYQPNKSVGNQN